MENDRPGMQCTRSTILRLLLSVCVHVFVCMCVCFFFLPSDFDLNLYYSFSPLPKISLPSAFYFFLLALKYLSGRNLAAKTGRNGGVFGGWKRNRRPDLHPRRQLHVQLIILLMVDSFCRDPALFASVVKYSVCTLQDWFLIFHHFLFL